MTWQIISAVCKQIQNGTVPCEKWLTTSWIWYQSKSVLGPGVAWWLRRRTTSRTVPGSIPGGVTGFFSDIFPSDRTMALGSTQALVKMSTRNIPGGKGGRCVRLTSPPSRAECHEIWAPKPPGTLWATPGLQWDSFTFFLPKSVFLQLFSAVTKTILVSLSQQPEIQIGVK